MSDTQSLRERLEVKAMVEIMADKLQSLPSLGALTQQFISCTHKFPNGGSSHLVALPFQHELPAPGKERIGKCLWTRSGRGAHHLHSGLIDSVNDSATWSHQLQGSLGKIG